MEQLLSQDLSVTTLLAIFIVGLFTKRFVPWWIHEEVLNKLKEYEETAPQLVDEMQKVLTLLEDPNNISRINVVAPRVNEIDIRARDDSTNAPQVRVHSQPTQKLPTRTSPIRRSRTREKR